MNREFNVINAFTLECSFQGPNQGAHRDSHFSQKLLIVSHEIMIICLGIRQTSREVTLQNNRSGNHKGNDARNRRKDHQWTGHRKGRHPVQFSTSKFKYKSIIKLEPCYGRHSLFRGD